MNALMADDCPKMTSTPRISSAPASGIIHQILRRQKNVSSPPAMPTRANRLRKKRCTAFTRKLLGGGTGFERTKSLVAGPRRSQARGRVPSARERDALIAEVGRRHASPGLAQPLLRDAQRDPDVPFSGRPETRARRDHHPGLVQQVAREIERA